MKEGSEMKYVRIFMIFIVLSCFFSPSIHANSTHYPLQIKFPQTMIYKAHTNKKVVALTFDDGPDEKFTPKILDILKKYDVKGTFFLLGTRVKAYPYIVERIHNEGHIIGNHTYWHPQLTKTGVKNLIWEIDRTERVIYGIIGEKTKFFRAPYGALNDSLVKELERLGYVGVGWSVDSEDWQSLPVKTVKKNILNGIHPGAIVLLHSGGHWTQDLSGAVQALDELIPYLKEQGYTFVTIPELWKIEHQ